MISFVEVINVVIFRIIGILMGTMFSCKLGTSKGIPWSLCIDMFTGTIQSTILGTKD